LLYSENGGNIFIRNLFNFLPEYTASQPKKQKDLTLSCLSLFSISRKEFLQRVSKFGKWKGHVGMASEKIYC
jgi:hypothetical protein